MRYIAQFIAAVAVAAPSALWAHEGGHVSGFLMGLAHPVGGADHLLAMVSVGIWAAMLAGRALWAMPLGFVVAMLMGGAAAYAGLPLPGVEPMILASVVFMGCAAALVLRFPPFWATVIASIFGLFHGHAHGAEAGGGDFAAYALGFGLATAALHLAGVALGLSLKSGFARKTLRFVGAATALAGLSLAFG